MKRSWLPAFLLPCLIALPAHAAGNVSTRLVADTTAIQAGKPFTVAIVVIPAPGWHVYWKNPGDAGLPTKITFQLPPGFTAADVDYPLPERFSQPGGITAFGYEQAATFLATITPPADLPAGAVPLHAKVSWLCCKDVCIPGHATVDLSLPAGTAAPDNADLFQTARAALPADHPPADVSPEAAPGRLGFHFHWSQPPASVELFPFPMESLELTDPQVQTQGADTRATFAARLLAGQTLKARHLNTLVVYTTADGARHGFYTPLNLGSLVPAKPD